MIYFWEAYKYGVGVGRVSPQNVPPGMHIISSLKQLKHKKSKKSLFTFVLPA